MSVKSIKLLEENVGEWFMMLAWQWYLEYDTKSQATEEKNREFELYKN